VRYPQAQPRTAPPTRVDGSDVTMDQEVPHAGTPMAVPINFRFSDLVLIRTHPFAFPCVGRLITVLTTRGLRWMDTKCPHGTSGCKHVCDVHSCVTSWSCNYIQNPAHTLACRLAWPWQTLPCARWSVSVEGHGLFHEWCYPAVLGARRLCRTAQPTG
jgi:hypothetical protein